MWKGKIFLLRGKGECTRTSCNLNRQCTARAGYCALATTTATTTSVLPQQPHLYLYCWWWQCVASTDQAIRQRQCRWEAVSLLRLSLVAGGPRCPGSWWWCILERTGDFLSSFCSFIWFTSFCLLHFAFCFFGRCFPSPLSLRLLLSLERVNCFCCWRSAVASIGASITYKVSICITTESHLLGAPVASCSFPFFRYNGCCCRRKGWS